MEDCSVELVAYHDEEVTLSGQQRTEMRDRRNSNRDRLKAGLKRAGISQPLEFRSQGSYAMRLMVQHDADDYDIDDGVYFDAASLVGPRGAKMTALQTRQMVRDAVDDGSFKSPPEVHKNCVRLLYEAGYHVDLPIYRLIESTMGASDTYELASVAWKRSDARHVTKWFDKENRRRSPDIEAGDGQLRRMVRYIKKFARSRPSWVEQILCGFGITALVVECYRPSARDDVALLDTMEAIHSRLQISLVVPHPVTPGEMLTKDSDDRKARFLRDKLTDALDSFAPLRESGCTHAEGLKCWDKLFFTDSFTERISELDEQPSLATSGLLTASGLSASAQAAVRKDGGGRYA